MGLAQHFLAALPAPVRSAFEARFSHDELEACIGALVAGDAGDAGDAAHESSAVELVRAIAARIDEGDAATPEAALASFEPYDLALALGCARGEQAALERFERAYGADMDRAIRKSPGLRIGPDEFRQIIREKLFVRSPDGDGTQAPRVASYSGRAPLAGWVRVTCARTVIDLARRKDERETLTGDDALAEHLAERHDPEQRLLRERYAPLLPAAFAGALAKLTPRQRNLLRQRYLHGIAASKLAASYGVHRATLFGWIDDARGALLKEVRAALRAAVVNESLDSIVGIMGSELDVSIRRMLDSRIEPEPRRG